MGKAKKRGTGAWGGDTSSDDDEDEEEEDDSEEEDQDERDGPLTACPGSASNPRRSMRSIKRRLAALDLASCPRMAVRDRRAMRIRWKRCSARLPMLGSRLLHPVDSRRTMAAYRAGGPGGATQVWVGWTFLGAAPRFDDKEHSALDLNLFLPTAYYKGQKLWQQHQPLTLDTIDVLNTHLTMSTSTSTSPSPMSIMVKNKSALILIHRQGCCNVYHLRGLHSSSTSSSTLASISALDLHDGCDLGLRNLAAMLRIFAAMMDDAALASVERSYLDTASTPTALSLDHGPLVIKHLPSSSSTPTPSLPSNGRAPTILKVGDFDTIEELPYDQTAAASVGRTTVARLAVHHITMQISDEGL
ncbi:hypothetical protein V8E36_007626 [Tilletia maclaganii]